MTGLKAGGSGAGIRNDGRKETDNGSSAHKRVHKEAKLASKPTPGRRLEAAAGGGRHLSITEK